MKLLKNNWLWVFLWAAFIMWMPSGDYLGAGDRLFVVLLK